MASTIHSLAVKLAVRDREFHSKMKQAKGTVGGVNSKMIAMGAAAAAAGVGIVALSKAWQSAQQIARLLIREINNQMQVLDKLAKDSKRFDLLAGSFTELRLQAELAGVEMGQFDRSLARMQVNLGDIASASGARAAKALEDMGLNLHDILDMDADEQFRAIGDGLRNVSNFTIRASHAQAIFGRAGREMLAIFADTKVEIEDSTKSMKAWFDRLNKSDIKSVEIVNDEIAKMKKQFEIIKQLLTIEIAPTLQAVVEHFNDIPIDQQTDMFDLFADTVGSVAETLGLIPSIIKLAIVTTDEYIQRLAVMAEMVKAIATFNYDQAVGKYVELQTGAIGSVQRVSQASAQVFLDQAAIRGRVRRIKENRRIERNAEFVNSFVSGIGERWMRGMANREKIERHEIKKEQDDRRFWEGAYNQRERMIKAFEGSGGKTVVTWEDAAK